MSKYSPARFAANKFLMREWKRLHQDFFKEITVPLFEFQCNKHGIFDSYSGAKERPETRPCPICGKPAPIVEYPLPAKRNPEYGIVS